MSSPQPAPGGGGLNGTALWPARQADELFNLEPVAHPECPSFIGVFPSGAILAQRAYSSGQRGHTVFHAYIDVIAINKQYQCPAGKHQVDANQQTEQPGGRSRNASRMRNSPPALKNTAITRVRDRMPVRGYSSSRMPMPSDSNAPIMARMKPFQRAARKACTIPDTPLARSI